MKTHAAAGTGLHCTFVVTRGTTAAPPTRCGLPAEDHHINAQSGRRVPDHAFSVPLLPTDTEFEIWEVEGGRFLRKSCSGIPTVERARQQAETWTEEARANAAAEQGGPVQPRQRSFVAVRATIRRDLA